jgi:hypothetical protein
MVKTIAIAAFATVMGIGLTGIAGAADPPGGQSSSELGSLGSQSGSPSESGKTGIGSTSGSDASIDTGLKATSQDKMTPCPGKSSAQSAERNKGTGIVEGTLGDQQRQAKSESKDSSTMRQSEARSSAEMSARLSADPCADAPASGSQKDNR